MTRSDFSADNDDSGVRVLIHGTAASFADEIRAEGLKATNWRPFPVAETRELAISDAQAASAAAHLQRLGDSGLLVTVRVDQDLLEHDVCRPNPCTGRYLFREPISAKAVLEFEEIDFGWSWISAERTAALWNYIKLENAWRNGEWSELTHADVTRLYAEMMDLRAPRAEEQLDRLDGLAAKMEELREQKAETAAKVREMLPGS